MRGDAQAKARLVEPGTGREERGASTPKGVRPQDDAKRTGGLHGKYRGSLEYPGCWRF